MEELFNYDRPKLTAKLGEKEIELPYATFYLDYDKTLRPVELMYWNMPLCKFISSEGELLRPYRILLGEREQQMRERRYRPAQADPNKS